MSEFVVHSVPGSPFGRAVLIALHEKQAPFRFAAIPPGGTKAEPHLSRHPFGRVPVLEHDGFMIYETQAILRYLDRVLGGIALTPSDPKAAGRMDQVMNICDWYLFQGVNNIIGFQRVVAPRLLGLPTDEAAIAAAMPRARTVFAELSRLLGAKAYFTGDAISLADILAGSHMDFLSVTPEWTTLTEASPNLVAWRARLNARESFAATTWERVSQLAKAA